MTKAKPKWGGSGNQRKAKMAEGKINGHKSKGTWRVKEKSD